MWKNENRLLLIAVCSALWLSSAAMMATAQEPGGPITRKRTDSVIVEPSRSQPTPTPSPRPTPGPDQIALQGITSGGVPAPVIKRTVGVYGSSPDYGVFGNATNTGTGVIGFSPNGNGVYGYTATGYAGFFDGRVQVGKATFDQNVPLLRVVKIPLLPSGAAVCFNREGDLLQCGASSLRWKTNVQPFIGGLNIVKQLRPITFTWKEGGQPDIGLGAEDVAKVAPSFTFTDNKGEITGVKYERLDLLLINAIKEQQSQIETLRAQNAAFKERLRVVEKQLRTKPVSARRRR